MGIIEREEREKGTEEIFEIIMAENFPPIKVRHQNHRFRKLREQQQDECQKNYT